MAKSILLRCVNCQYCKQIGRQQTQRGQLGRKRYFCKHPRVNELKDEHGLPLYPFIGFGDMSKESQLTLKTRKKWCPMEVDNDRT